MNDTDTIPVGTVDTRDMVVVHTALLREIRCPPVPGAAAPAPCGTCAWSWTCWSTTTPRIAPKVYARRCRALHGTQS